MSSKIKQNHLGNAFVFMVRYALPRNTSADMATVSALRVHWSQIPEAHRKQILDTIQSEKDLYKGNDPWLWNEFLSDVEAGKVKDERYDVVSIGIEEKPFTQSVGSRPNVVVVKDNHNGNIVAVDYFKAAHKNKAEAIRILQEQDI